MLGDMTTLTALIYGMTVRACLRQILPPLRPPNHRLRASETVREYLQSFSTPGQRLFYYDPTHMLVLLLARLPNGRMPKGARSLEVQEVWETPGAGDEDHGRKCEQFFLLHNSLEAHK